MTHTAFYNALGVSPDASTSEIQKAWKKAAAKSHPDKNPNDPQAKEKFQRLAFIKSVLVDSSKRSHYDRFGEKDLDDADSIEGSEAEEDDIDDPDEPVDFEQLLKHFTGKDIPQAKLDRIKNAVNSSYKPNPKPTWTKSIVKSEWQEVQKSKTSYIDWQKKYIEQIPDSFFNSSNSSFCQEIQEFRLNVNQLTTLPDSMSYLTGLQVLDLSVNKLTNFPPVILQLTNLTTLKLENNNIQSLPESMTSLKQLVTFSVFGNQITQIAEQCFEGMTTLRLVDLECNPLQDSPQSLRDLQSTVEDFQLRISEPQKPSKKSKPKGKPANSSGRKRTRPPARASSQKSNNKTKKRKVE